MTRREFEQAASLREELAVLKSGRNQNPRTEDLERLLKEAESLPGRLPDPKARIIAQKVLEHGAPIPWKQIVAELGLPLDGGQGPLRLRPGVRPLL